MELKLTPGAKLLVVADGDRTLARETAERLGRAIYAGFELVPQYPTMQVALDQVAAGLRGLTVLGDVGDNPEGGGAVVLIPRRRPIVLV